MPCGLSCVCINSDPPVECLSVVDPVRFGFFRDWCHSGDPHKRNHVLLRSRIGIDPTTVIPVPEPAPASVYVTVPEPNQPPGLFQKAKNFGRALVTHVVHGLPQADHATVTKRLEICHDCHLYSPDNKTCLHQGCGCNLEIKVTWADQICPLAKW